MDMLDGDNETQSYNSVYIYYNPGKPYSNPIQPIHHEFDEHETIVIVVVYEFQHEFGTPFTVP